MKNLQFILLSLMVFAISCGTTRKNSKSDVINLESTSWQVEELNGKTIAAKEDNFTLLFNVDNAISAKGACNIIFGNYTQNSDNTITIAPVGSTRTACPDMDIEMQFIQALEATASFEVTDDNTLNLMNDKDAVIIKLSSVKI